MTDERLERELTLARRAAPGFGLGRQQQVIWGVRRRLRPAPSRRNRVLAVAAAACLLTALAAAFVGFGPKPDRVASPATKDEHWELRDGSRILIETPDTKITKQRESDEEVSFELAAGAARFDVAHRPERTFRVRAGLVDVLVVGTRFRVERRGERASVAVERGRVLVSWAGDSKALAAGEQGVFPPLEPSASSARATASPASVALAASASAAAPPPATLSASAAPLASGDHASRAPSAEELFETADHARAAGHAQEAVRALKELTQRFPHDGRSPLAAFTRGRLLLENLGQPGEAARAFAQARALAGGSSALSEDALAREAGAWRAAGNSAEAARCAELYQTLYPRGAHRKEVLRVGTPPPAP